MRLPGSTQLALGKRFLETLMWNHLAVVTNLASIPNKPPGTVPTSATADGKLTLSYALSAAPLTLDLSRFAGSVTARWFDPVNGDLKSIEGSPFPNREKHEFVPPGKNSGGDADWILVLQAK